MIYCLLRSDSLWQLVPFSWCSYCKASPAYELLRAVEETDSLLPRVRLLDLIKAERYGGCERLIALNTRRLYLKGYDVELDVSGVFF